MRILFLAAALVFSGPVFGQTNTFDTGSAGWGATGDPTSETAAWLATGGNPGGYIRVTDAAVGGTWYFDAPAEFTGNKCDAYGKFLRYDQFTSDTNNQQQTSGRPDVMLFGGGLILAFDNAVNPGLNWTHYDVPLVEGGWRIDDNNGPLATEAQMRAVLASVSGLRIRGEYRSQDDFGGLDNVVFESAFHFDLDSDDSSGAFDGDFLSDTICLPPGKIVDDDPVLTSEAAIDSIRVTILFAGNFEEIEVGLLPPGLSVQIFPNGQITLINTGNATVTDFLDALQTLLYQDFSPLPARDTRLIEYRVFVAGCGEMAVVNTYLPLYPAPSAGLDGDTTLCAGSPPLPLSAVLGGAPETGGFWQPATRIPGQFDPASDPPGTYAYLLRGAGECPGDTAFAAIAVQAGFQLRSDTTVCYGDTLTLNVPPGLNDWAWSDGSRAATLDVTTPGSYGLTGQAGECTFSAEVNLRFYTCKECPFYAPNAFSPNDDGANDLFQVFLPCAWTQFRLEIFDRWGGLVFAGNDPEQGWGGFIRGKEAAPGVFFWRVEWEGELFGERKVTRKTGDLLLLR